MAKWFGEQKEWTPNELSFMVKAASNCRRCQEEGRCKWGSKACCECKWQAPMAAIKELDSFTQSRIEDKADQLDFMDDMFHGAMEQQKRRERIAWENLKIALVAAVVLFFFAFAAISVHGMPYEARVVMRKLAEAGPDNWYYDHKIDCKDWSLTFLDLWYQQDVPDRSCVLVRNMNPCQGFDHLMVAVWENNTWLVIEPQACNKAESLWGPEHWWGSKYDKSCNMFGQSWLYLANSDKPIGDLMRKTKATQIEFERSLEWERQ